MNKKEKINHCCEAMEYYLQEQKVLIFYNPVFREYFIGVKSYPWSKQTIYGCPWCGKAFLPSLVDKYVEILENEYNIFFYSLTGKYFNIQSEDFDLPDEAEDIPEEFKSDAWWKKRNL